jgi:hypothetical protein
MRGQLVGFVEYRQVPSRRAQLVLQILVPRELSIAAGGANLSRASRLAATSSLLSKTLIRAPAALNRRREIFVLPPCETTGSCSDAG